MNPRFDLLAAKPLGDILKLSVRDSTDLKNKPIFFSGLIWFVFNLWER
jgi:hypothetical protein